jgi:hypothetical protein
MKEQDHMSKGVYRHCKKEGHYMRDYVEFLKWLNMRGIKYEENHAKRRKNNLSGKR